MRSSPSILVVEDDPGMRMGLEDNLRIEGYRVASAASCRQARAAIGADSPDLVILDRMLPDGDSVSLCAELRTAGFRKSIIMLTAKGEEIDRVIGLESGADDYVVKPFSLREFLARVHAHLRRGDSWGMPQGWVNVGVARVDFGHHRIERDGVDLEVSAKELELLRFLVVHRGEVVSRDVLLQEVWDRPHEVVTRTVDNFIVRLRKKIEPDPASPRYLVTVHGSGYKLVAQ
ncbi:MAG: Transcriptional regulatory protein WalR [Gammaproteobacteria bacterium]|nr:Transcriptional regulatory protein WalR [Gammaproteobacteria bacterium]